MLIFYCSNWTIEFGSKGKLGNVANFLTTFQCGMIQRGHVDGGDGADSQVTVPVSVAC